MGSYAQRPAGKDQRNVKNKRRPGGRSSMRYAEMELATGSNRRAIELAKQTLRQDPSHVGALEVLAKAQWQGSQCDELLLTLRKLIELNPYEPGYHSLLAGAYQSLGLCGEAVKAYMRAVDLGMPKSAEMDAMIEELRSWQASLVADLLKTDLMFRASYEQDPAAACAAKGFDFAIAPESTEHILRDRQSRAVVYARPS